jgi:hypothetical protein
LRRACRTVRAPCGRDRSGKDARWLAVGDAVIAGVALHRHRIDASLYWVIGLGVTDAAGIPLRFVPIKDHPMSAASS